MSLDYLLAIKNIRHDFFHMVQEDIDEIFENSGVFLLQNNLTSYKINIYKKEYYKKEVRYVLNLYYSTFNELIQIIEANALFIANHCGNDIENIVLNSEIFDVYLEIYHSKMELDYLYTNFRTLIDGDNRKKFFKYILCVYLKYLYLKSIPPINVNLFKNQL